MPGIGIIANPHSKLNKRSPVEIKRLQAMIGHHGVLSLSHDLTELDKIILSYRNENIDIIAINGGDGSISRVITRVIALYGEKPLPKFALLRGGTMNLVSAQLGIGASWLCLKLIVSFLCRGALIRRVLRSKRLKASLRPFGQFETNALGSVAGTITSFPMGLRFLPLAMAKPGYFQTTIVDCPAEKLLWQLPFIMLQQKEGSTASKHSFCCKEAHLHYEDELRFTVDGEIYLNKSGSILIETGPELEFLRI
ncbi:MAG: diacylglycerol kinase family protein [Proteobacteria bacterium]|nr:diacylglycerol kinase family protein [Pseudomonadota bacterium]